MSKADDGVQHRLIMASGDGKVGITVGGSNLELIAAAKGPACGLGLFWIQRLTVLVTQVTVETLTL